MKKFFELEVTHGPADFRKPVSKRFRAELSSKTLIEQMSDYLATLESEAKAKGWPKPVYLGTHTRSDLDP